MAKVLIVDDDESILDAISMLLEDFGYKVDTSVRGEDTYKKIKNFSPDLILLDYLMSGISGRDICLKLKKNKKTKGIPIVVVSAHPSAQKMALESGAEDFLAKPFDKDDLLNTVAKYTIF